MCFKIFTQYYYRIILGLELSIVLLQHEKVDFHCLMFKLPLKIGHNFDSAPMGPLLVNCPTANSIYSKGIPHVNNIKKYGMRKTPANTNIITITLTESSGINY